MDFETLIKNLNYEEKLVITLFYSNKCSCNEISDILNTLFYSIDTFEESLKKLNEFRLLITYRYKEEDKYLFVLKEPLTREEFIKNEVFVRYFILKTSGPYYQYLIADLYSENNYQNLDNISYSLNIKILLFF